MGFDVTAMNIPIQALPLTLYNMGPLNFPKLSVLTYKIEIIVPCQAVGGLSEI